MLPKVTDRLRTVLDLAKRQSHRFNHPYIGTSHVLLGLVQEGGSVAAHVLTNLRVDLRMVRLEVEKRVQSWPDPVAEQKLPMNRHMATVVVFAREEARHLDHNYLGTEHLLLGLLRDTKGVRTPGARSSWHHGRCARQEVRHLLEGGIE